VGLRGKRKQGGKKQKVVMVDFDLMRKHGIGPLDWYQSWMGGCPMMDPFNPNIKLTQGAKRK